MIKFVVPLILFLSFELHASQGNDAGGGGKKEEIEFAELGQLFVANVARSKTSEPYFQDLNPGAYAEAIARTQVFAKDDLCFDVPGTTPGSGSKRCLDAQYLPDQHLIELSLQTWQPKTCIEKLGLVVHEYGRAAGLENGNYNYSSRVRLSKVMQNACSAFRGNPPSEPPKSGDISDKDGAWLLSQGTLLIPRTDLVFPAQTQTFNICGSTYNYSEDGVASYEGCDQLPIPNAKIAICRFDLYRSASYSQVWKKGQGFEMRMISKREAPQGNITFMVVPPSSPNNNFRADCYVGDYRNSRPMSFGELKIILGHFFEIRQPAPKPMKH